MARSDGPADLKRVRDRRSAAVQLAFAASTVACIFGAGLILPVPFWRAQPPGPAPAGQPPATDLGLPAALLALAFAIALCLPYRPYALALRWADAVSTRTLLLLTAALAAVSLLIYPAFGSDLFVYLDYQRMWTVYGANPLLAVPNLHPEDWSYPFVWIPQQPNPYGPLWSILTWPIALVSNDSLWSWIGGYKLLNLISYAACCGFVWLSSHPTQRNRALVFFAWSPLVLFEVLGKAHNDSLLAVSALASVWLVRRHPVLAMLCATAGMLVKLSGLAVLMGLGQYLIRRHAWRATVLAAGAAGLLSVLLYAPFWNGPETLLPVLVQTSRVVWSPGALLIGAGAGLVAHLETLVRLTMLLAWAAACLLIARSGRVEAIAEKTALLLLATLMLLTTAFFAHYLVPVVGLAAVAANRRLERLTIALSIGSLLAYSVELLGPAMPSGWIGSPGYQLLGSAFTLAPGTALLLRWAVAGRVSRQPLAALSSGVPRTASGET